MRLMVKYDDHHTVYFGHQHISINIFCDTCYQTHDASLFSLCFLLGFFVHSTHTDYQPKISSTTSISSYIGICEHLERKKHPIAPKLDWQLSFKSTQKFLHFFNEQKFQPKIRYLTLLLGVYQNGIENRERVCQRENG